MATMTAAWRRPHRTTPPKAPTSHQRSAFRAHAIPAMPRIVTVCGQIPLAAMLQTGVANPNARTATNVCRAPSWDCHVTYMTVSVSAVRIAAVSPPGTTEKLEPPRSMYAGNPAATTPGDRPMTGRP